MAGVKPHAISPEFTRDELARQNFVTSLRQHVLVDQAAQLRGFYDEEVLPRYEEANGAAPASGEDVRAVMKDQRRYRFFSSIRTNAQEMVYASVIPAAERDMDSLADDAQKYIGEQANPSGSLTLDPSLEIPSNVSDIDVHRTPGSYHPEYRDEDVAVGAMLDSATRVFAFKQFGEDLNDIGATVSNYVRLAHPHLTPEKILDAGCMVGHNTLPWAATFPNAEVHGIDVAGGPLRYAHARAEAMGLTAHFRQMNATAMQYEDESFDVVFSSMFLHELPIKDIKGYLHEAYRVLKPGGLLINMELPPNSAMGAYEGFYLDWDCYYNNEPFYKGFRDQDYRSLCVAGGFSKDDFLQVTLPRYTFVGEEAFQASLDKPATFDKHTGRMDPKGTRWYCFGAHKPAG